MLFNMNGLVDGLIVECVRMFICNLLMTPTYFQDAIFDFRCSSNISFECSIFEQDIEYLET